MHPRRSFFGKCGRKAPLRPKGAADDQARAHNDAGLESQATNPGGARPSYDWEAGRSTTYRLDWDIDMGSSAKASDRIELDIDGFWTVRVLEVAPDHVHLVTVVEEVQVLQNGERGSALEDAIENQIVYLDLRHDGGIDAIRVPKTMARVDGTLLEQINAVQLVLPTATEALSSDGTWSRRETLGQPNATATYSTLGDRRIRKIRLGSERVGADDEPFRARITHSELTATLTDNWFSRVSSDETVQIEAGDDVLSVVRTRFDLQETAPSVSAPLAQVSREQRTEALASTHGLSAALPEGDSAWEQEKHKRLVERYKDVTLQQVVTDLEQAVSTAREHADTVGAIEQVGEWIQADPKRAAELAQSLRTKGYPVDVRARLVHGLELASDTPEAQKALVDLFTDRTVEDGLRQQALVAAADPRGPATAELRDAFLTSALDAQADGLGSSPVLGLGVLASHDAKSAASLRENFAPVLLSDSGHDPDEVSSVIDAFRNGLVSGDDIHEAVSRHLSHPDSGVRASAVDYLSEVGGASTAVFGQALSDPAYEVQRAAVDALFREGQDRAVAADYSLTYAAQNSTNEGMTLRIVRAVAESGDVTPYVERLNEVARVSESDEVRKMVHAAVSGEPLVEVSDSEQAL